MADITRHRATDHLRSLRHDIARMMEDVFPLSWGDDERRFFSGIWSPRVNMTETKDAFLVTVDLPGVQKDDIKVSIEDMMLTITGERKEERREEGEDFMRMESRFGRFHRVVPLPKAVMADGVAAELTDGILRIRAPKSETSAARTIDVV